MQPRSKVITAGAMLLGGAVPVRTTVATRQAARPPTAATCASSTASSPPSGTRWSRSVRHHLPPQPARLQEELTAHHAACLLVGTCRRHGGRVALSPPQEYGKQLVERAFDLHNEAERATDVKRRRYLQ